MTDRYVASCLFCRIVAGEESAYVVFDGPDTMAFLDTRPVFKGHTLVLPRPHVDTLLELPAELGPASSTPFDAWQPP
jgi:histidine triad (HIT) family protein